MRRSAVRKTPWRPARAALLAAALVLVTPVGSPALDRLDFAVAGGDRTLERMVRGASLLLAQQTDGLTDPQDLFAAARADYARILGALYAAGHYSAVINITLDGREAAAIAPLDAPASIRNIKVSVTPGPLFHFSRAQIAPLAWGTELPTGFRTGEPAASGVITEAVTTSILGWRNAGHAKAKTADQDLIADHPKRQLSADITLDPGPKLRFGPVTVRGTDRMIPRRVLKIAGLPEGETFSQLEMDRAANRLRRTGVFSSVSLTESERIVNGDLLPIGIDVTEMKTRRYSIGAEIASVEGLSLTGYWMHRNLLGGAERLKIDGAVTNIGGSNSGMDYELGVTIDRPATITADTTASLEARIGHLDEEDYDANFATFGLHFTQYFSESLTLRAGLAYEYIEGTDPTGDFRFRNISLPMNATWDRRDDTTDAKKGFYIDAGLKPFYGFDTTGSGARLTFELRGYRSFGEKQGTTLALRVQGGAILGSDLLETPRDDLFFSGGGGTVRGQPYRSLGVVLNKGLPTEYKIGATSMLAASAEVRTKVTESIGVVGFIDWGKVHDSGFSDWHAGAGLGLRYATGFGPIRFDLAAPVGGNTGDGVQFYIGLGQSF